MKYKGSVPVVATSDVRSTVAYYSRVLGFKEHFVFGDPAVYAGVERDGVLLYINLDPRLTATLKDSDLHPDIFLWVQDVDAALAEHRKRGANVIEEISVRPWDARQYVLEDPNGYRLKIAESVDEKKPDQCDTRFGKLRAAILSVMTLIMGSACQNEFPAAAPHISISQPASGNLTDKSGQMPGVERSEPFENTLGMKFVPVPGTSVLFSLWDTRVQDYQAFVRATGTKWKPVDFEQGPTHPAVNVSWLDARKFCQWLSTRERTAGRIGAAEEYRLPTDAEWSVAAGLPAEIDGLPSEKSGSIPGVFAWGKEWPPTKKAGNYCDASFFKKYREQYGLNSESYIPGYDDGFADTSPVTSFPANAFGLRDMGGNVWQWCEDWYDTSKRERVLRGASFTAVNPDRILLSFRYHLKPDTIYANYGFRCVLAKVSAP